MISFYFIYIKKMESQNKEEYQLQKGGVVVYLIKNGIKYQYP